MKRLRIQPELSVLDYVPNRRDALYRVKIHAHLRMTALTDRADARETTSSNQFRPTLRSDSRVATKLSKTIAKKGYCEVKSSPLHGSFASKRTRIFTHSRTLGCFRGNLLGVSRGQQVQQLQLTGRIDISSKCVPSAPMPGPSSQWLLEGLK